MRNHDFVAITHRGFCFVALEMHVDFKCLFVGDLQFLLVLEGEHAVLGRDNLESYRTPAVVLDCELADVQLFGVVTVEADRLR